MSRAHWSAVDGMATATYPANRMPTKAAVTILPDGSAHVQCGTQDIGTGTYTIIAQVAAVMRQVLSDQVDLASALELEQLCFVRRVGQATGSQAVAERKIPESITKK